MEYAHTASAPRPLTPPKRPVIFLDWDGTLADSMPLCLEQLRRALAALGLPPRPEALLAQCNGPTYAEALDILGIPPEQGDAFLHARQRIELQLVPTWQRLFPGVADMLRALAPWAELAVVSNGLEGYLRLSMETLGIAGLFARVEPLRPGRDKEQALREALGALQPLRSVMVGDRRGDLLAGKACGLPTIAACYGFGSAEEWALADRQAATVAQLRDLLLDFAQRGALDA